MSASDRQADKESIPGGATLRCATFHPFFIYFLFFKRQTDRDRQTKTDRQKQGETETQRETETERETERERDRTTSTTTTNTRFFSFTYLQSQLISKALHSLARATRGSSRAFCHVHQSRLEIIHGVTIKITAKFRTILEASRDFIRSLLFFPT